MHVIRISQDRGATWRRAWPRRGTDVVTLTRARAVRFAGEDPPGVASWAYDPDRIVLVDGRPVCRGALVWSGIEGAADGLLIKVRDDVATIVEWERTAPDPACSEVQKTPAAREPACNEVQGVRRVA